MAEIVTTALRAREYVVDVAADGRTALDRASTDEPDLIILDLGLPDIDGLEVCRELRRWFVNPILVLSAAGDDARKVAALDEGADDYITKPFSIPELLARIRVALRHRQTLATIVGETRLITVGDLTIDAAAHGAAVDGAPLTLTAKEFALLKCLALRPGRLLPHRTLLDTVWGTTDLRKTESLRVHITQLRKKLGSGPDRPSIMSEPGLGYRLIGPTPD
ncbi:MAG: response regulator transcription factor [Acidobacteria bacterium]|nr:response regulator transcription factor [Acidobacteriota bacterium]